MNEDFEPGNHWAKVKVIILLTLVAVAYYLSEDIVGFFISNNAELFQSNPDLAIKKHLDGLLALTIVTSFLFGFVSMYFVYMGIKVKRDGRWPPTGMKMAFKTKIRKGRYAKVMSMLFLFSAFIMILYPAVNFYAWYSLSKTIETFSQ